MKSVALPAERTAGPKAEGRRASIIWMRSQAIADWARRTIAGLARWVVEQGSRVTSSESVQRVG